MKSKSNPFRSSALSVAAVVFASFSLLNSGAQAADAFFIGSAGDHNLTTGSNWVGGSPPAAWDSLVFGNAVANGILDINSVIGHSGITLNSGLTQNITINATGGNILLLYAQQPGSDGSINMSSAGADLTINGPYTSWTHPEWNVGAGRTLFVNGGLDGGAAGNNRILTKGGAGVAWITGGNSLTGGTNINGGVLVPLRNGLGTGALVINNSGVLYVNDQWVLCGVNGYGVGYNNVASVTVNAGGQIALDPGNGYANGVTNLYLNGGSVSGGPPDPNLGSSYGGLYLYNGNEQITAGGATASTISASLGLTGNNNTITVDAGSSLNNSGVLKDGQWGAGGFIKAGTGTQTLSGANTYSGNTTVTGGMLSLGQVNSNNESSTVSITASAGAKLDLAFIGTDTVGSLFINGVQQPAGNYTSAHASGAFTGGGTLSVASGPAGYASWKAVNAPTGTPGADYDGDGVSNGSEFVLGGTKDTNDLSKLPAISTGGANMVFTFQRAQASIDGTTSVAIQVSTNLSTWPVSYNVPGVAQANNPGVTVVKNTSAGFDTVTLTVPRAPDAAKFARLVVTPAP